MNISEFQQKVSGTDLPVIVDFWADWCMPCRMTKPILEKLADEYAGRIEFIPVNADDSREVLEQFHVTGIPTVLNLHQGKETSRVTGVQGEANFRILFESVAKKIEVNIPTSEFDRSLRLGAGILIGAIGLSTSQWIVAGFGGMIAFAGMYDRCPILKSIIKISHHLRVSNTKGFHRKIRDS